MYSPYLREHVQISCGNSVTPPDSVMNNTLNPWYAQRGSSLPAPQSSVLGTGQAGTSTREFYSAVTVLFGNTMGSREDLY